MRAWIGSGKGDWRRPLPRPSTRTCRRDHPSAGFALTASFHWHYSVRIDRLRCGLDPSRSDHRAGGFKIFDMLKVDKEGVAADRAVVQRMGSAGATAVI